MRRYYSALFAFLLCSVTFERSSARSRGRDVRGTNTVAGILSEFAKNGPKLSSSGGDSTDPNENNIKSPYDEIDASAGDTPSSANNKSPEYKYDDVTGQGSDGQPTYSGQKLPIDTDL